MLSKAQLDQFQHDGFLVIRQAADAETCAKLLAEAKQQLAAQIAPVEFEADVGYPGAPTSREAAGGKTIRRLLNAYARHQVFRDWVESPKLAAILEQLLGGQQLWLTQAHHNCIMTKQPGFSSQTAWHQDIRYWSFDSSELINLWLALTPETEANGCLSFIPGTHNQTYAADRYDPALFLKAEHPDNAPLIKRAVTAPLSPGDIVLFHAKTFHAAGNNRTEQTKYSAVFTFHNEAVHPVPITRSAHAPEVLIYPK